MLLLNLPMLLLPYFLIGFFLFLWFLFLFLFGQIIPVILCQLLDFGSFNIILKIAHRWIIYFIYIELSFFIIKFVFHLQYFYFLVVFPFTV